MPALPLILATAIALTLKASAQTVADPWGQCGGTGWSGATTCPSGYTCTVSSEYYSQCIPGSGGGGSGGGSGTATTTAAGGSATLVPGYSFIRAVQAPNFHKYLQSEILETASDAVLGEPADAAQFEITGGQLVQHASAAPLYATVEAPASAETKKLKVTWSASKDTLGTFVFQGDSVEWSSPSVKRQQNNAWLVCEDTEGHKDVYINLGPYSYQTPEGCVDQTIHGYTGSTATA
ncbi:carbohydrate-binding module family 1 protein [Schizophyllum commune H4-8]|uniref:Carbohydrate-binding module family 1 protein n=1 Tax=Schizophyllum commune (strain H4-8 / FGSC 9210) TaxID=578458 RepID=D8Q866_SCHCM|nr:carbohydrate-binding module family 1 protein [Schizophyllum commune H4-8]KAI5891188.1 carbohydrate-binding module family 1 protein [Schizophyllum commune H4-8]